MSAPVYPQGTVIEQLLGASRPKVVKLSSVKGQTVNFLGFAGHRVSVELLG